MNKIELWNGKEAPRMGLGTWVMGGEQYWGDMATGWSHVDDGESLKTLQTAFDIGVRIIDTAAQYGAGHAEEMIGKGIKQSHIDDDEFVICSKAGFLCDPLTGNIVGTTTDRDQITKTIDASLKRLQRDTLDLVFYHIGDTSIEDAESVFEAFALAYEIGKIQGFGWSTDDVERAMAYADWKGYSAVQHDLNIFKPADAMLRACEENNLWAFNRQPLAMGFLSGKYDAKSLGKDKNDVRASGAEWLTYFDADGRPSKMALDKMAEIRAELTMDGRSVAQGALGWCLAQSKRAIPIPGCRTPSQARDNFGVLNYGPLSVSVD